MDGILLPLICVIEILIEFFHISDFIYISYHFAFCWEFEVFFFFFKQIKTNI